MAIDMVNHVVIDHYEPELLTIGSLTKVTNHWLSLANELSVIPLGVPVHGFNIDGQFYAHDFCWWIVKNAHDNDDSST